MQAIKRWAMRFRNAGRKQRGFTLISTTIGILMGSSVLLGGWTAYRDLNMQMKVTSADRRMDQYAHSAMKEVTNLFSWAWAARRDAPFQWRFMLSDLYEENGPLLTWRNWQDPPKLPIPGTMPPAYWVVVTFRPQQGILFGGVQPRWVSDRSGSWYQWGGKPVQRFYGNNMGPHDRMTLEKMEFNWNELDGWSLNSQDPRELEKRHGLVKLKILMQYQYRAASMLGVTALYGDRYVRQRSYETQFFMRNWGVHKNTYRDALIGEG